MEFSTLNGVILDMDGVLWLGEQPLPGMLDLFEFFHRRGIRFVLATNNSAKSPADYVAKLARMGVLGVEEGQIITSGIAAANYLQTHYPTGMNVHVLGGDGLKELVTKAGYVVADEADVVVAGIDTAVTYEKLKRAVLLIRKGAVFIGTNADVTIPTPEGLAPGAGSILAALQAATDCEPTIMGKPNAPMFEAALRALNTDAAHALMIGDRLQTDILGAQNVGIRAALVLTGVATRTDLETSPVRPDTVYGDLPELITAWEAEHS
jgi:4-nitrophenyl phosphatase